MKEFILFFFSCLGIKRGIQYQFDISILLKFKICDTVTTLVDNMTTAGP